MANNANYILYEAMGRDPLKAIKLAISDNTPVEKTAGVGQWFKGMFNATKNNAKNMWQGTKNLFSRKPSTPEFTAPNMHREQFQSNMDRFRKVRTMIENYDKDPTKFNDATKAHVEKLREEIGGLRQNLQSGLDERIVNNNGQYSFNDNYRKYQMNKAPGKAIQETPETFWDALWGYHPKQEAATNEYLNPKLKYYSDAQKELRNYDNGRKPTYGILNEQQAAQAKENPGGFTNFFGNLEAWDKNKGFFKNIGDIGYSVITNPAVKYWSNNVNRLNNHWQYANMLTGGLPAEMINQGIASLVPHQKTFFEGLHPAAQGLLVGGAGLGAGMAGLGLYRRLSRDDKKGQQPMMVPMMPYPVKQGSLREDIHPVKQGSLNLKRIKKACKASREHKPIEKSAENIFTKMYNSGMEGYNKLDAFLNSNTVRELDRGIDNWYDLLGNSLTLANNALGPATDLADVIRLRMTTPKTTALGGMSDSAKNLLAVGTGAGLAYGGYRALKDLSKKPDSIIEQPEDKLV